MGFIEIFPYLHELSIDLWNRSSGTLQLPSHKKFKASGKHLSPRIEHRINPPMELQKHVL
jgi:hypothetical protein